MYFYEFNFSIKEINKNKLTFSILLQSDTGFYDTSSENALDVESFLSPEDSETKIIFLIGKNCWHPDYEKDFDGAVDLFKRNPTEYVKILEDKILLAKSFKLTDFFNLDTTHNSLIHWVNFCNKNGIKEIEIN